MKYELRQYDNVLLTFTVTKKALGQTEYVIDYIDEMHKHLLPIGMSVDSDGLEKWLRSRIIPQNREFVDQVLSKSGLSHNDTIGIINLCKGLSLNDSYWVVESGFRGTFEKYNLYQNRFTRTLALIAYTGYGSHTHKGFTSSPEYTTNGMLRKCWRRIDGKIYLYKGGTSGAANAGKEPYSEFYASQIAEAMGISHVTYDLKKWKGLLCSTCELFTDIDTSYVPIHRFVENANLAKVYDFIKKLGQDYLNAFSDMMIFDAVICNTDRHFGNFGLMVDNKTNRPVSFAPLFDHGLSLLNYAMDDDLNNIDEYARTRTPAFEGVTFDELVKEFMTNRQRDMLRKLLTFEFRRHSTYNLPKQRLKIIEKWIQRRAGEMLK